MKYLLCWSAMIVLTFFASYKVAVQEGFLKPITESFQNSIQMTQVCDDMKTYRQSMGQRNVTSDELTLAAGYLATEISVVQKSGPISCQKWQQSEMDTVIQDTFKRSPLLVVPYKPKESQAELSKK